MRGTVSKNNSRGFSLRVRPNVTCSLSSSCHVAHKASTQSRQPAQSAAAICTSLQFFHPAFSLSLSAVFLHVVFGLPRFRRPSVPSGVQVNAVLQSLFGFFLMMWPMNFHLLFRTPSLRFSISAIFRTSLFVVLSCQRIFKYPSKASASEDYDFILITFIHLPRLATIHQDWLYQSLI